MMQLRSLSHKKRNTKRFFKYEGKLIAFLDKPNSLNQKCEGSVARGERFSLRLIPEIYEFTNDC
jgi:hypothetical protein